MVLYAMTTLPHARVLQRLGCVALSNFYFGLPSHMSFPRLSVCALQAAQAAMAAARLHALAADVQVRAGCSSFADALH